MSTPRPIQLGDTLTDFLNVSVHIERLAQGGFGLVAMGPNALDPRRWLALKTLRPDLLARNPNLREVFLREALTWMGVWTQSNVLTAEFVTEINSLPFLVLNYAEYGSLRDLLQRGSLPMKDAFYIAQNIAAGLAYLHTPDPEHWREAVIHRDLKPENLLIQQVGQGQLVQITDFGLAKTQEALADLLQLSDAEDEMTMTDPTASRRYRTQRGVAMGTAAYMPPEQWEDAALAGMPADVYAMGIILGELFLGDHPLLSLREQHTTDEWRQAHTQGLRRSLPLALPRPLQALYERMLSPSHAERPTAPAVLAELQATAQRVQLPTFSPWVVPSNPSERGAFWLSWGQVYDSFGYHEEALARLAQAIEADPNVPFAYETKGTALMGLKRYEEALKAYEETLAVYARVMPNDPRQGVAWGQRAICLKAMGRYAEAEASYIQALTFAPQDAAKWNNRANNQSDWARAEAAAGRLASAREHIALALQYGEEAIRINPNNPAIQRNQAITLHLKAELEARG